MIAGNHDQVSLGGEVHGITPLQYAFCAFPDQVVILDAPTLFMGCLFVAHTRNLEELTGVLASEEVSPCQGLRGAERCLHRQHG